MSLANAIPITLCNIIWPKGFVAKGKVKKDRDPPGRDTAFSNFPSA